MRKVKPLSDADVRNAGKAAKKQDKEIKRFDGGGLFLLAKPNGSMGWRLKYKFRGRERLLSLGVYPDVSLALVRKKRDHMRKLIAEGVDPIVEKRSQRSEDEVALKNTFEAIALEWMASRKKGDPETLERDRARLKRHMFPTLGKKPIATIDAEALIIALKAVGDKTDTVRKLRQALGQIWRFAVNRKHTQGDVTTTLRGEFEHGEYNHFAAITEPREFGKLLRAIDGYTGQPSTLAALKVAPYVFVRPGELRAAEWKEFDLDADVPMWRIPGTRTKMKTTHLVPLAPQVVKILRDLHQHTGDGRFLFPSLRGGRCMSENTLCAALRGLGYDGKTHVAHGFRSSASSMLNEQGYPGDVIELQLAHQERNKVRAAYNRAQRVPERVKMMREWATYLDGLRAGGNVIPFRHATAAVSA